MTNSVFCVPCELEISNLTVSSNQYAQLFLNAIIFYKKPIRTVLLNGAGEAPVVT